LLVTSALVSAALTLVMVVFAAYRKQKSLILYATGFVGGTAGIVLQWVEGASPTWFEGLASHGLLMLFYFCIPWGMRHSQKVKPHWARRFWVYLAVWLTVEVATALVAEWRPVRSVVSSALIMTWIGEFLYMVRFRSQGLHPAIRGSACGFAGTFLLLHLIRIVLLTSPLRSEGEPLFTLSFSLVFSVLWAGIILFIEVAGLLKALEDRNAVLKNLADTDELTGLLNRHRLELAMGAEIDRSFRYSQPLSLILFDLDHFKQVNDTWGHPGGDGVLRKTAEAVRGLIRGPDSLYRWGGEEFMVLAPQTTLEGASQLAEKLRQTLESTVFSVDSRVTASFGVAQWNPPESRESWIEKVDLALYRAKNGGRNQVVSWNQGDVVPVVQVRLEWRPEWSSGNEQIDSEHVAVLELANGLLDKSLSRQPAAAISRQLDQLLDHVVLHFSHEEEVLARVGYPHVQEHAQLHRKLTEEALALRESFRQGTAQADSFFQFLVSKVVVGHLLTADVRFFPYTKDQSTSR